MKKCLLATITCLIVVLSQLFDASAQTAMPTFHRSSQTRFDNLMPCRNPKMAAKTTSDNGARVIGITNLKYDGTTYVPMDSSFLTYGTGRGSWYSQNSFAATNYDMATSFEYVGSSYNNYLRQTQTFDVNNNILSYTEQAWIPWLADWRNDYQELNTYDAMHNQLTNTSQLWDTAASTWVNNSRSTNTYTAANKLATSLWENWNASSAAWENGFRASNAYDATNFPLNSVSEVWNLTTSTWDSTYRVLYQTDAFGNITVETAQSYDMTFSGWMDMSRYTYTYDVSNRRLSELYETFDMPSATWIKSSMTIYSGYTETNAGSIVSQTWDVGTSSFINSNRDNYVYNSYGQPTLVYNETWSPSTGSWMLIANSNFAERYYYETYVSNLTDIKTTTSSASIYPVPATNTIVISVDWNEPQSCTISITDMLGRTIRSWDVKETSQYTATIAVTELPAGNYIARIQGRNDNLVRRIVIEK